jgi:hypothetical protein
MKLKPLVINLTLLICSTLFVFFTFEVLFRVFYPQSGYSLTYASWGWTHLPNSRVTYYKETPVFNLDIRSRPYPIPIKYNSKGLREFDYGYPKEKNVFRILVLGDSFAEDMGSFFDNLHTKWLERKLKQMGYPYRIEVINAGHYAFDNANEYMFYLKEGKKYSPDIVILMYTGDTAGSDYAGFENGKLVLRYKTFTFSQKLYRMAVSWVRRNSQFGSFLLNEVTNLNRIKLFLVNQGFKEKDKAIVNPDRPEEQIPFSDADKAIWLAFKEDVEKNNGRFIFMNCTYYPDQPRLSSLSEENRAFIKHNKILLLEVLSTAENARRIKNEEMRLGIYNKLFDSHRFGYKANEKVAERIITFLLDHKLLPEQL